MTSVLSLTLLLWQMNRFVQHKHNSKRKQRQRNRSKKWMNVYHKLFRIRKGWMFFTNLSGLLFSLAVFASPPFWVSPLLLWRGPTIMKQDTRHWFCDNMLAGCNLFRSNHALRVFGQICRFARQTLCEADPVSGTIRSALLVPAGHDWSRPLKCDVC